MSDGTKLGDANSLEFENQLSESASEVLKSELSSTKLGEMSDFEKSLLEEGHIDKSANNENTEAAAEAEPAAEPKQDEALPQCSLPEVAEEPVAVETKTEELSPATNEATDFESHLNDFMDYQEGDVVKGTVRAIEKSGVLVDISYKSDGFIPNNEFSVDPSANPKDVVEPGQEVEVFIDKLETKEGYTMLSRKKAEFELLWNELSELSKNREIVDIDVTSKVDGGLVVQYMGIKGFIPASHISAEYKDNMEDAVGTKLPAAPLHVDRKRRKIIFSNRLTKSRHRSEEVEKLLATLEVGSIVKGRISSIKDFGAFVDIGGIEGLVHISEMSWARVNHPSDLLEVGDETDVFVLGIDKEKRKVSLGIKQLKPDPWTTVTEKYSIGQVVNGTIGRLVSFGAFTLIEKDLEGLIHISEIANEHIENIDEFLKPGDEVKVKIIKLVPEDQKIGLSLKAVDQEVGVDTTVEAEQIVYEEPVSEPEAPAEDAVTDEASTEEVMEEPVAEELAEEDAASTVKEDAL